MDPAPAGVSAAETVAEPAMGRSAQPLRVAIVTTSFPRHPGDFAGHFVARLAEALSTRGHSVEVVAPHAAGLATEESWATPGGDPVRVTRFRYAPDRFERVAYGDGIPTNVRRDWRAAVALPAFMRALRKAAAAASQRSDIVHAQWAPTAALATSPGLVVPMVVTLHGSDVKLAEKGGIWKSLLERGLRRPPTQAVIAVSDELAERLRRMLPVALLPRLTVVRTGVERSLLDRPRPVRKTDAPLAVAFVGRLLKTKGVFELAEAFATLPPSAMLVIAGDGPEREAAAARLAASGVATDRVTWLGAVERDLALDVMAAADIVAIPSWAEGAGLVAVEASALGTCVVASRTGIMPEVLSDEQLVPPRDAAALAEALARLGADPAQRARLAADARRRVAVSLTWDVLAAEVEAVYREVLTGGDAS
jgi:glycosyltransferase involved in cell wall biosynthesis